MNVGACRIVLGILPGLEMQVLADTEGLIKRLFDWATNSKEPLQSYATGNILIPQNSTQLKCQIIAYLTL